MSFPNVKFIAPIEIDFEKIQSDYLNLSQAFKNGDVDVFKRLRQSWDEGEWMTYPLSRIREAIVNYYEDGHFAMEVRNNLFTNHIGALEFTKVVFAKQHNFIEAQFPKAVPQYFNNVDNSQSLVEIMLHERETMSDKDFYQAVQFQFIQYFKWLEEQFYWIYPLYQPYLLGYEDFNIASIDKPEYIKLQYDDNNAIIKALHEFLYPTYIEVSLDEFSAHFEDNGLFQKMKWKKTQKGLAALFNGVPYLDKATKKPGLYKLKMKNNYKKVMNQHFLNKYEKAILPDLAEKSKDSFDPEINSKDITAVKEFLKMLHDMKVGEKGRNS